MAAALLGSIVVSVFSAAAGLLGVRVALEAPTDALAGDTLTMEVRVSAPVPQLRTLRFLALDGSTHAVEGKAVTRVQVRADRRTYLAALPLEIRVGLLLGIVAPSVRFSYPLAVPLAVAPVPAIVSLVDTIGEDPTAEVRTVRAYTPGDPARLVHWRSTARRGELMVRELESAELLRGARLQIRVTLPDELDHADGIASHAAGLAIAALDAGLRVDLLTYEQSGPRDGEVVTRRDVGRRLAAAIAGEPPRPVDGVRVAELGP